MHERNQAALEKLHREDHDAQHDDLQQRFRLLLTDRTIPLPDRVRIACSFGVVLGGLLMPGDAFEATPNQELSALLRDAVHDVLRDRPPRRGR